MALTATVAHSAVGNRATDATIGKAFETVGAATAHIIRPESMSCIRVAETLAIKLATLAVVAAGGGFPTPTDIVAESTPIASITETGARSAQPVVTLAMIAGGAHTEATHTIVPKGAVRTSTGTIKRIAALADASA